MQTPDRTQQLRDIDIKAADLGVDFVIHADLPDWWCRQTAPVALSWKRELAAFLGLMLAAFAAGLVVGVRLAG